MRRFAMLAVLAALAVPAAAADAPWPACRPRSAPIRIGITQVGRARDGRLVTLWLRSRAMGDVQPVRVLLPAHYDASGATRYPVLYLLHGAGGSYRSWLDDDHIDALLGDMPIIAVMPNGTENGLNGGYSDWYGLPPGSVGSPPAWESFHIRELIPFIDASFPTIASAAGRAIAGISMGGGGATKYAAEYPGTFGYVGAFSGETDPELPVAVAFQDKTCKWGDPATQPVRWRDNDSTHLAGNLRGVRVFVRCGDGTPGVFDPAPPAGSVAATIQQYALVVEFGAHLENEAFVGALRHAGVRDVDVRYFHGSHSRPYWDRDATAFLAWLRAQLRDPVTAPQAFHVTSAHAWFTAWGWRFAAQRSDAAFATVRVSRNTISAAGRGLLHVLTPPRYRPHTVHRLRVGGTARRLRAGGDGRLRFTLRLAA